MYRQVRTQKRLEKEGGSHTLESTERETSQDKKVKQTNKALTIWRCKERKIRTQVESRKTRVTYQLESMEGGTDEDTGRMQAIEGHSLSGKCRRGKIRT
jgi:hypothetical protein